MGFRVAIVGATGNVGREMMNVLAEREFPADEVVVSTHPPGRSNWLELGVVAEARLRFDVPVTHVVVDMATRPAR